MDLYFRDSLHLYAPAGQRILHLKSLTGEVGAVSTLGVCGESYACAD